VKTNFLKVIQKISIAIAICCSPFFQAMASEGHGQEKKFNAGEMIMHHIGDAHDWHIADIGHTHISVPLPVILINNGNIVCFSSGKLTETDHHGIKEYGDFIYNHGHFEAKDGSKVYDLSITKNTAAMMVSVILLMVIFLSVAKSYTRNPNSAPKGLQSFTEPIILFVRDEIAKASIGPKYEKYMPFLLTVFFFIWGNNLLGLIPIFPGGANVTGNIAVTLVLAVFTFLITSIGIRRI
jgi:F-type H+-transporting ATPase subunit a